MNKLTLITTLFALVLGAFGGNWYAAKKSEDEVAYSRIEYLYRESAIDIKTYSKLLRLIRNGESERALVYLESLLSLSEATLEGTSKDAPNELKESAGSEAISYLKQYRAEYPSNEVNHPNKSLKDRDALKRAP